MIARKSKFKKILDMTPESLYWLGFLLADGHFSKTGTIQLIISDLDRDHLEKFQAYFGGSIKEKPFGGKNYVRITIGDRATVCILKDLYNINSRKTYNPPNLSSFTEEQLFCMSVGFIDGDGHVRADNDRSFTLSVAVYYTWKDTMSCLFARESYVRRKYAFVTISNLPEIKKIKKRALDLNLPLMPRKWDKIDIERVTRNEHYDTNFDKIVETYRTGLSIHDTALALGVKPAMVKNLLTKNKLYDGKKRRSKYKDTNLQKNNTTGIRGLLYRKDQNRWFVNLQHKGVKYKSKNFITKEDAVAYLIELRNNLGLPPLFRPDTTPN